MKKKINFGLLLILSSLIVLTACGTKKLNGDYTGKINLILTEATVTLRFDGDKVMEVNDEGIETNEGTYKITDNELEITYSEQETMTAEMSKDKKSFVIKSADGIAGAFVKDIKFTKQEK